MAIIVNGDGILTGVSSLATALTDLTSGRGTVTGVATVGTLQLGTGVSMSSPRTQNAAIFTNNTEFLTVDDAGRIGIGTITPNSDAHPQNVGKINVGFITARSVAGDIDANTMVVAGISTFVGAINGNLTGNVTGALTGAATRVTVTDQSADTSCNVLFTQAATGDLTPHSGTNLTFNSSTGALTASSFVGDLPIANGANNRIVTTTGSASITGESNLTFDGDGLLTMTSASGPAEMTFVAPSSSDSGIYFNDGSNDGAVSYDHSTQNMNFRANALTRVKIDGPNNRILVKRNPSSDVDIVLAKAQRWGYSDSYQGLIIGNPAVGTMSSLFLNYDPSSNTSGAFAGDGREIVVRKNAKIIVPNAADNGFYNGIEFNAGGDRDDGVSRFRQGIIVSNDSGDANVLHDYEEGTWTPVYVSSNSTISYTTQQGFYTKVGDLVHVTAYIRTSSVSSSSHSLVKVSGLPFAEGNAQRTPGSVRCNGFQGTLSNMNFPVTWSVEASQTFGELQRFVDGGNTDFTTSTMNNASFVYLQCTYNTAT